MPDAAAPSIDLKEEARRVRSNRRQEALDAGLTSAEAEIFSDNGIDVGQLRKLVAGGAPAEQIALIVV